MAEVSLQGVGKAFPGRRGQVTEVLSGIDATIGSGEFLAILGASGCGKSTLLRMISGLESVTEGAIAIDGQDVTGVAPEKRELAMVFQNYALFPHLDVAQNITFGLQARRADKDLRRQRLQETSALLGLDELLDRRPAQLSGGQRQRVALGRALVSGHRLILMDEPLSNLDAKLRAEMRTEIKRIQRQLDLTIIYVTHDQVEAMTMADRVLMLAGGRIEQLDTPAELYRAPATTTVGRFIGSPPMNIIALRDEFREFAPQQIREDGGSLGVRPESVLVEPEATSARADDSRLALGRATVLVNELLGADRIIAAELSDGTRVVARVHPDHGAAADDTVLLSAPAEAAHWYCRAEGRRITQAVAAA
ncbi:ABC transporter ATP-binding protein [Nesterenkonia aerolata]|uniref:ABC transporter ATP-binding protein n=1 Tax=Nesterenkonia aerolata TaxID=3074079 RepID=A0ABU2DQJ4_9MICC|nr:ABC transporter ATP-binding protein [Nesterenkonia sp. LY-0111]MDR8018774.1 ABC transporter ATP-binding protein [Nesterenkonia sp. LY-0111]